MTDDNIATIMKDLITDVDNNDDGKINYTEFIALSGWADVSNYVTLVECMYIYLHICIYVCIYTQQCICE